MRKPQCLKGLPTEHNLGWLSGKRAAVRTLRYVLPGLMLLVLIGCGPRGQQVLGQLPNPLLRTGARPPQAKPAPTEPPVVVPMPVRPAPMPRYASGTVVIDPGHGGEDPGTRGCSASAYPEKTIVLAIANHVTRLLRQRGVNVVQTRTGDWFISLDGRVAIAERHNCDLFVSIHVDASPNRSASGITIYTSRSPSARSERAAQSIYGAVESAGFTCRGIKQAGYRVLKTNSRPCLLIECGFLSNSSNARRLNDPGYQERIAESIASGIANYLGR